MILPGSFMRRPLAAPVAAVSVLLVLAVVSCGRKSGVDSVREQATASPPAPAAPAVPGEAPRPAAPPAAGPTTLGTAYARFLDQPAWTEEDQEPLKFVVVRGVVRGTGDKFEGWFAVGGAAPVMHHFVVNGQQQPAERFAAYAGSAALRQALR